ncbi:NAD(P)-binding protein [Mollisia scopiformis]|uniref:NAD(P)-binding protein n=1 Tax=Mollisia scopiformis TaxID=149040 RepID=A0A194X8H3_MOLSC|nr:NAD(P)-binding protein [Mollisia scopiformis]KUJ16414.1 NAD(P)-binding protein [Mollisia scopiformis]
MSSPTTKTVAIFGATGGTGLAALKLALKAGHTVRVLARTPSKLSSLSTEYPNLYIVQGDIRETSAIKATLTINDRIADIIISAVGMVIEMQGLKWGSKDPHICEEGTKCILSSLASLENEDKVPGPEGGPRIVLLSTTGISDRGRDIPIGMIPLYHWMLSTPHNDKKKMEECMISGEGKGRSWVMVRPSFLTDGKSKGLEKVRVSTEVTEEGGKEDEPAIGYFISREDVALWIVEECVNKDGKKWEGKTVTLTH